MFIVVHMDYYYPSIIYFDTRKEAEDFVENKKLKDDYESYIIGSVLESHAGKHCGRALDEDIEWSLRK